MFKQESNAMFNNSLFSSPKIGAMHETTKRLYEAARILCKTEGQSAVARLLNASPQTIKNWETRGMSNSGMISAQRKIGCNATWLETGLGDMAVESISLSSDTQISPGASQSNAENAPRLGVKRRVPVVGTAQLGDNKYWAELETPVGFGDGFVRFATRDENTYALRCKGDSMRPRIKDGEFVIVEPNHAPCPGDEVLVKAKDGRVMVKELLYVRDDTVHLMSVNEAHPTVRIHLDEIDCMHLVVAIAKRAMWEND